MPSKKTKRPPKKSIKGFYSFLRLSLINRTYINLRSPIYKLHRALQVNYAFKSFVVAEVSAKRCQICEIALTSAVNLQRFQDEFTRLAFLVISRFYHRETSRTLVSKSYASHHNPITTATCLIQRQ